MITSRIPTACAVALFLIPFAATLSADPIKCGHGLLCDWIEDTPTRGAFLVSHPGAIRVTEDPFKDQPHSFVSPSGYWTVVFDFFKQYKAPDGMFDPMAEVDVKGYMQHLLRPPGDEHKDDPQQGDKFKFDLTIYEWLHPEDSADGKENHGHTDTYYALLGGTDAVAPKTGILSYNFAVKGQHTEIFENPLGAPEPATYFLVGTALMWPVLRKRRQR